MEVGGLAFDRLVCAESDQAMVELSVRGGNRAYIIDSKRRNIG